MIRSPRWLGLLAFAAAACTAGNDPASADPTDTTIAGIQGPGPASPLEGLRVRFEGIVSGDFEQGSGSDGDLGGFFVQAAAGEAGEAFGVFVYTGEAPAGVARNDRVRITGRVQEFHGETQVRAERVETLGRGAVEAVDLPLPAAGVVLNADGEPVANLERYEGMLVRIDEPLVVTSLRDLERFGELRLAAGQRPLAFTQTNEPDPQGFAAHGESLAARTLRLDDGRRARGVRPVRFLDDGILRTGDAATNVTGNLRYARGSGGSGAEDWRIVPTAAPVFDNLNARPDEAPAGVGLRIATINLQNLFLTPAQDGERCGPRQSSRCRGADTRDELERQLAKTVTAIRRLDADILGVIELENTAGDAVLETLVAAVNQGVNASDHAFVATGPIGSDAIRVGIVYRPGRIDPVGRPAILDSAADPRFDDGKNRPVVAQAFRHETLGTLTVAVAHLKSKGSDCDQLGDPDLGDGEANCSRTRTRAAAALADWALTVAGDTGDAIIVGDLNAYPREAPVAAILERGFVDLVARLDGDSGYSYLFDGQAGRLDHALATRGIADRLAGGGIWHVNADEPPALDYNLDDGRDGTLFDASTPYRFSDHDPVVVTFDGEP